ncbi:MAG TPA: phosphoribosylglycinamide formyltransferase [Candidatus Marinimicrobia bacterium]|nr:phosphoribosylglycinamide formyltransferase [Candidatus Neomarinimicrobiota bacterium]
MKKKIAVFASGAGSNFQNLVQELNQAETSGEIVLLICNKSKAGALKKAAQLKIPALVIRRKDFQNQISYEDKIQSELIKRQIDLIVLSGYLQLLPESVISRYQNRVINIHPALLPAFGGKGFYGDYVHQAVLESGVKISGISIHFVNSEYDKGRIILQKCVEIENEETIESLRQKIHTLEYYWFPKALKWLSEERIVVKDERVLVYDKSADFGN